MKIILIGMPGCGKTTIGRQVAKRLGVKFIDMDDEIEKREGRRISEIFETDGEDYFRNAETECLKSLLDGDGIISTGGGIVVRDENMEILKSCGVPVVFIDRPLEKIMGDINTSSRPLLKDGAERLKSLYAARYDRYLSAASVRIVNDKTRDDAAQEIIRNTN